MLHLRQVNTLHCITSLVFWPAGPSTESYSILALRFVDNAQEGHTRLDQLLARIFQSACGVHYLIKCCCCAPPNHDNRMALCIKVTFLEDLHLSRPVLIWLSSVVTSRGCSGLCLYGASDVQRLSLTRPCILRACLMAGASRGLNVVF